MIIIVHDRLTIHRLCFRNLKIKNINILTVRVGCDILIFFKNLQKRSNTDFCCDYKSLS